MRIETAISEKIEDVDLTIAITMPVRHWRELMRKQDGLSPVSRDFGEKIAAALGQTVGRLDTRHSFRPVE